MKKNSLKVLTAALILSTATFAVQSCSNDDDPIITTPAGSFEPGNFKGEITSGTTITLDPSKVYKLTGPLVVKEGGKLIIPAGTRIEATGGTSAYVTVEQGGQIFANGTAAAPVVFTASNATPGAWGGLVICGRAPINKGTTAMSEVGNATYGGTIATDNSGTLNFVRIEYAGAIFTAEKEFNGLSLFGVGSGTQINNLAVINGSDDGIEFFGGTVNATNILSVGNEDDAFDWTEGWNGTVNGVYTKRRADNTGNRGIEADNNSNNRDASPRSNPTIKNATFIGALTGEADGIKLREGTHATIDNVVLSGWKTGINVEHDQSVAYFNGAGKITNVRFDNVQTEASAKATAVGTTPGVTIPVLPGTFTVNAAATGAGGSNGTGLPSWATGWSGLF